MCPISPKRGEFGAFEGGLLIVIAIGLTVTHFGGSENTFLQWYGEDLAAGGYAAVSSQASHAVDLMVIQQQDLVWLARQHPDYQLLGLVHWVAFCVIGLHFYQRCTFDSAGDAFEMHLGWGGLNTHWRTYAPALLSHFFSSLCGLLP